MESVLLPPFHAPGLSRINMKKIIVLPKLIYVVNAIPIKILMSYFTKLGKKKTNPTIYVESQKTTNTQNKF